MWGKSFISGDDGSFYCLGHHLVPAYFLFLGGALVLYFFHLFRYQFSIKMMPVLCPNVPQEHNIMSSLSHLRHLTKHKRIRKPLPITRMNHCHRQTYRPWENFPPFIISKITLLYIFRA